MDKGYPSSITQRHASLTSAINSSILSRKIQRGDLDIPKWACHSTLRDTCPTARPNNVGPFMLKKINRHNNATKMDARRWSKRLKIPLDQRIHNARSVGEWLGIFARRGREGKEGITNPSRRTPAPPSGLFSAEGAHGNCSNLKMRGFADQSVSLLWAQKYIQIKF